ncbi:MAG TPA: cytochrome c-type biogenesis CcmF C-terminal domain-containing protein, partial [Kiloniellales bacterium]|nr:cytochrome c-type biogenesis CcmF C-terminal domain-containing protein [Kiloniellales bacterium]
VEKRDALKAWTILLAILTFSLSLIGTFIVRSGVLTSVHAFASDPERGRFILLLLAIAIGGSLILFALRAPTLRAGGLFAPVSREGALVLNNLLLSVACATVFLGTLYPLFLEALTDDKVSVGPPFYARTFVPIMVPLLAATAIGPFLSWKRADLAGVLGRLKLALFAAVAVTALALWLQGGPVLAALGMGLAAWLTVGALVEWSGRVRLFRVSPGESLRRAGRLPRSAYGMTLAHAGLGIAVAGIVAAATWKQEEVRVLQPGESLELAGYEYRLDDVRRVQGPNYESTTATFTVTRGERLVAVLTPEKRFYPVQEMPTTEAAIHTTGFADLYAVIGDPDGQGGWTVRIFHEPMVPWMWAGALLMIIGGGLSLSDRRLRIGAPRRRREAPATAAAVRA